MLRKNQQEKYLLEQEQVEQTLVAQQVDLNVDSVKDSVDLLCSRKLRLCDVQLIVSGIILEQIGCTVDI